MRGLLQGLRADAWAARNAYFLQSRSQRLPPHVCGRNHHNLRNITEMIIRANPI
jgi:hypothetical protein